MNVEAINAHHIGTTGTTKNGKPGRIKFPLYLSLANEHGNGFAMELALKTEASLLFDCKFQL